MKQKDYIIIALIVMLGAIFSIVISKLFIGGERALQSVEVVQPISAKFPVPDKRYFNPQSFDPTQTIKINPNENETPFDATTE